MTESPRATYRIQLTPKFGLWEAAEVVPYLAALGVSHVYLSPVMEASAGSEHGYDVVDHSRVRAELGGEEGFSAMALAASNAGLGLLLDTVPNHMAIGSEQNRWWWDVLEDGPNSSYARYFDVDWDEASDVNLIPLPVLEDRYGRVLEAGLIRIVRRQGSLRVEYRDHAFPLSAQSQAGVLERTGDPLLSALSEKLRNLVRGPSKRRASRRSRIRIEMEELAGSDEVSRALDGVLKELNSDTEQLHLVLEAQNYRLTYWRKGIRELGYRRFFDISTLAALRVEDDLVFEETHRLLKSWVDQGLVSGLRIDHIDGLRHPKHYLERLVAAGVGWVVVEKILGPDEALPKDWPVAGTTGYDFLNVVNRLWVDENASEKFDEIFRDTGGGEAQFPQVAYESKIAAMRGTLAPDVLRLSSMLAEIAEREPRHRDFLRSELHDALTEVIAFCPVYRTYAAPGEPLSEADLKVIEHSIELARANRPDLDPEIFELISAKWKGEQGSEDFTYRLQQTTGPVAAKGIEDTALYRYVRLTSLNEVGGEPGLFGIQPDEFHARMRELASHPLGLLATSTHDTKRSEDVRARISALTEVPDEWEGTVGRWFEMNAKHKVDGLPDRATEYLLYQSMVGAHPLSRERAASYMLKAAREAKLHTSWMDQQETYEAALEKFIEKVFRNQEFLDDVARMVSLVTTSGMTNSIAQVVVKLTAPGVPDIYQGCELWDYSLVDPDNRRPVDYEHRRHLLSEVDQIGAREAWQRRDEGVAKMFATVTALRLRTQSPHSFGPASSYFEIPTGSPRLIAYGRGVDAPSVIVVFPRLTVSELPDSSISLPPGSWRDLLGEGTVEGTVSTSELFESIPISLLVAS